MLLVAVVMVQLSVPVLMVVLTVVVILVVAVTVRGFRRKKRSHHPEPKDSHELVMRFGTGIHLLNWSFCCVCRLLV